MVRGGAAISAALGAWVALGAVAVAPGPTVASRVAILPPFWILGALLVLLVALVFGARWSAARARPLFAALLALAPLLPFHVPAVLLLWQGVPAAMLFAGIAVAVVAAEPVRWPARVRELVTTPRVAPRLAVALAVAVFALAWRGTANWIPAGDEPHYLVITQSLLRDFDLRIDDNHQRRDYLEYHDGELKPDFLRRGRDGHVYSIHAPGVSALIAPAFAVGGYPAAAAFLLIACALGTSLVWRLAWQTAGSAGAAWFGWAVVALSIPVVAHAYTIFPDGVSSVLLLCAVAGLAAARDASPRALVLAGAAAAALPWLHTRTAVIAGVVGAGMGARLLARRDRWRAIATYAAVPLASAAVWFSSFRVIYGTFNPAAPYGGYAQSRPEYLLPGILGLFFDQQYGFLATAPGFAAALAGLAVALSARRPRPRATAVATGDGLRHGGAAERPPHDAPEGRVALPAPNSAPGGRTTPAPGKQTQESGTVPAGASPPPEPVGTWGAGAGTPRVSRQQGRRVADNRRLAFELVATFVLYLITVASYRMWWGGASAPARFLVPVLLPLGLPAAWAWRAASRAGDRAALVALVTLSALLCAAFTWGGDGMVAFTTRALYGPLYEWMTRAVDLSSGLPGAFRTSYTAVAGVAAVWTTAAVAAWMALRVAARTRESAAALAPWAVALAVTGGIWGSWTVTGSPPLRVDSSRLAALLRIEPRAHALLIGARAARGGLDAPLVAAPRVLPLLQLQQVARGPMPEGQIASAAPLRAGSYRLVLSPALPLEAIVGIGVGHGGPVITKRVGDVPVGADQRRAFTIDLPVEVDALIVSTPTPAKGPGAWIEPIALSAGAGEFAGGRAAAAKRYGDLIAYFVTDRQFPEPNGIWIRPDSESVVIVQPDAPCASLTLTLRNGPYENGVDVRTDRGTERLALAPGEERVLDVPLTAGARAAALAFRVARWFRPAEVDPDSDDVRRLGVWVEVRESAVCRP